MSPNRRNANLGIKNKRFLDLGRGNIRRDAISFLLKSVFGSGMELLKLGARKMRVSLTLTILGLQPREQRHLRPIVLLLLRLSVIADHVASIDAVKRISGDVALITMGDP